MKSAYELAMERLRASEPEIKLSDGQKAALAEVENRFRAKIAERELFLGGLIDRAKASGNRSEMEELQAQLARERSRFQADCEEEKERIRSGADA
jgi:Spy/CpxP family protein refolding chaperone